MKVVIRKYNNEMYISGYDLSAVKNIDMGIDSLMGFYRIENDFIKKLENTGYDIVYEEMQLSEAARIRKQYFDEKGDLLYRMNNSTLQDLLEWKKNMEEFRDDPIFEQDIYDELLKKIEEVQAKKDKDDKLRMAFLPILKDIFNELENAVIDDNKIEEYLNNLEDALGTIREKRSKK